MTVLLSFTRDPDTGDPIYAVIATDEGAHYVWNDQTTQPFEDIRGWLFEEGRINRPEDALGWLQIALANPGTGVEIQEPIEYDSEDEAYEDAFAELATEEPAVNDDAPSESEFNTQLAASEIEIDNPGLLESVAEGDPDFDDQAFLNYVLMAMGPIDPEGPNAWLLDAAEGKPVPEDARISFASKVSRAETGEEPE